MCRNPDESGKATECRTVALCLSWCSLTAGMTSFLDIVVKYTADSSSLLLLN